MWPFTSKSRKYYIELLGAKCGDSSASNDEIIKLVSMMRGYCHRVLPIDLEYDPGIEGYRARFAIYIRDEDLKRIEATKDSEVVEIISDRIALYNEERKLN